MKFELTVDGEVLSDVTLAIIQQAIDELHEDGDSFLVLEPELPIGNAIYMQAIMYQQGYLTEVRCEYTEGFKHYEYRTKDKNELLNSFISFFRDYQLPNLQQWKDITDEF